ncbi:hypothetical protein DMC30DRAFT_410118 [Rhodotorula diobovata]|uniref:Uncharacterized protein n=1 Tax=Rhodotorula diobovata TaxID=5288 RepID=A0A5C5FLT0_9BASI|nr:hypothetical protein DMC30DRAFT_410118 [Rhodotorula diobovata]
MDSLSLSLSLAPTRLCGRLCSPAAATRSLSTSDLVRLVSTPAHPLKPNCLLLNEFITPDLYLFLQANLPAAFGEEQRARDEAVFSEIISLLVADGGAPVDAPQMGPHQMDEEAEDLPLGGLAKIFADAL